MIVRIYLYNYDFGSEWCCVFRCVSVPQDDHGADSEILSLRQCIQKVEAAGMVDWKLGGHTAERPSQVFQGQSDDMFLDWRSK